MSLLTSLHQPPVIARPIPVGRLLGGQIATTSTMKSPTDRVLKQEKSGNDTGVDSFPARVQAAADKAADAEKKRKAKGEEPTI